MITGPLFESFDAPSHPSECLERLIPKEFRLFGASKHWNRWHRACDVNARSFCSIHGGANLVYFFCILIDPMKLSLKSGIAKRAFDQCGFHIGSDLTKKLNRHDRMTCSTWMNTIRDQLKVWLCSRSIQGLFHRFMPLNLDHIRRDLVSTHLTDKSFKLSLSIYDFGLCSDTSDMCGCGLHPDHTLDATLSQTINDGINILDKSGMWATRWITRIIHAKVHHHNGRSMRENVLIQAI